MPARIVEGEELIPGYCVLADLGGTAAYRLLKMRGSNGRLLQWKLLDLRIAATSIETRLLELLLELRHPYLNAVSAIHEVESHNALAIETDFPPATLRERLHECKGSEPLEPGTGRGVPPEELIRYFIQAAKAIDFLNAPRHAFQGETIAVYHRALRPETLTLFPGEGDKVCKISEFGLAKPVTDAEGAAHSLGLTQFEYSPPEFIEGRTTPTSDQFALAACWYELRTGRLPFPGSLLQQMQARVVDRPVLDVLPEPEHSVVRRALAREPSERFPSCTAFVKALEENLVTEVETILPPVGVRRSTPHAAERGTSTPNMIRSGAAWSRSTLSMPVPSASNARPPASSIPSETTRPAAPNNPASPQIQVTASTSRPSVQAAIQPAVRPFHSSAAGDTAQTEIKPIHAGSGFGSPQLPRSPSVERNLATPSRSPAQSACSTISPTSPLRQPTTSRKDKTSDDGSIPLPLAVVLLGGLTLAAYLAIRFFL